MQYHFVTVDYKRGQDPQLIKTAEYPQDSGPARIALTGDGNVLALSTLTYICLYSTWTGELDYKIENAFSGNFPTVPAH